MPAGEISVTCPGCSYTVRLPIAAVRRDNTHCSRCGMHIPLAGVNTQVAEQDARNARPRRKPPYRPRRR